MRTVIAVSLSVIAIMLFTGISAAQDTVECPEGTAPTIDGTVEESEWADADNITLQVPLEDECTVYYKYSGRNLYVAFQFEDGHTSNVPDTRVLLDTDNDMADTPQDDDYELYINPDNDGTRERKGNGNDWTNVDIEGWIGEWNDTDSERWSTEYSISFSKLTGNGSDGILGIGFVVYGNVGTSTGWPDGADEDTPSSWGNMTFGEGAGPGVHRIIIIAPALIDVDVGDDATASFTVSNSGSDTEIVELYLGEEIAGWASLDIDEFSIEPGYGVMVNITVTVPDGTDEGMYTVNVTATARSGANDTASIRVSVSSSGGGGGGGGDDDTPGFDLIIVTMAVAVAVIVFRRRLRPVTRAVPGTEEVPSPPAPLRTVPSRAGSPTGRRPLHPSPSGTPQEGAGTGPGS